MKKIILSLFIIGLFFFTISCKEDNNDKDYTKYLDEALESIDIPEKITDNITFNKEYSFSNDEHFVVKLIWETSNEAISTDGVVTRNEENIDVIIKVTASLNEKSAFKEFNVQVLKKDIDEEEILNKAIQMLTLPKETRVNLNFKKELIVDNNKVYIEWNTSNESLSDKGEIKRGSEDIFVDCEATLSFGSSSRIKEFKDIKILKVKSVEILMDVEELYIGKDALLFLKDGNEDKYNWYINDSTVATLDEEYFIKALKLGTVSVVVVNKNDPDEVGNLTIDIKNNLPKFRITDYVILIGEEFSFTSNSYDNLDLFTISIENEEIITYENRIFKAIKDGKTKITLKLKSDKTIEETFEVTIYPLNPVLDISSNEITLGNVSRVDVLNYEEEEYNIEALEEGIVSFNGRLVTGIKTGNVRIKVTLLKDSNIYSFLDLTIIPIVPSLELGVSNIIKGGNTCLAITNLEQLESSNIDDYNIEISSDEIISIDENFMITGLNLGKATITVTLNSNDRVVSSCEINVIEVSSKKDTNGEIAEGPLYVYIDDNNGTLKAGEMYNIKIYGAKSLENYVWISNKENIVMVNDKGRIIAGANGKAVITIYNKLDSKVSAQINLTVIGTPNVDYVSRIIKIAEEEIGYVEGNDNDTKYGQWYNLNYEPWCAMFVSWCANQAGINTDIIPRYCGCTAGSIWFISRNQFGYKGEYIPKAGDIIFFLSDGASHTGLVIACDGNKVYTIEGNTSDKVAKREYYLNHNTITGYGIPDYPDYDGETTQGGSTEGSSSGEGQSTD